MPREKRAPHHYVNNKEFTQCVTDWCREVREARAREEEAPQISPYIADSILRMAEGLSHKSNFIGYPFREDMVMDAVENMVKVLNKATFDPSASTRGGTPNAFGYFTQIAYYAFVRRIVKEKKEYQTKLKYIAESGLEEFMNSDGEDPETARIVQSFLDNLRAKIDDIKEKDSKAIEKKKLTNRRRLADSDLTEHFED